MSRSFPSPVREIVEDFVNNSYDNLDNEPKLCRPITNFHNSAVGDGGVYCIRLDRYGFAISLDVQKFSLDELKYEVVDGFLVLEAKHEEREDQHGFVSRQFVRRYKLPDGIDTDNLKSKLSTDGTLYFLAPKKPVAPTEAENA